LREFPVLPPSSPVPSTNHSYQQIQTVFRSIGSVLMAIVNGIGSIIMAIVNGIVTIFDVIIATLTCHRCGGRRRGGAGRTRATRRHHGTTSRI